MRLPSKLLAPGLKEGRGLNSDWLAVLLLTIETWWAYLLSTSSTFLDLSVAQLLTMRMK